MSRQLHFHNLMNSKDNNSQSGESSQICHFFSTRFVKQDIKLYIGKHLLCYRQAKRMLLVIFITLLN